METTGQTMGLDETLNGLNATEENGIDLHMMLPTEYGAVAILSASGYGNPKKLRDETDAQKRTTTGNATGVYFTGDRWEIASTRGGAKYGGSSITGTGSIRMFSFASGWHDGTIAVVNKYEELRNVGKYGENYPTSLMSGFNEPGCLIIGKSGLLSCSWLTRYYGDDRDPWDNLLTGVAGRGSASTVAY